MTALFMIKLCLCNLLHDMKVCIYSVPVVLNRT